MRTTIDRSGRLVIPRTLMDRMGLTAGSEVDLEFDGTVVRVGPVIVSGLRVEGDLLMIPSTDTPIDDAGVRDLIDADRHAR